MVLRFGPHIQDLQFVADWVTVAQEEAQHFQMLCSRLVELEHVYGDMPAHDGLWQAAAKTSHHVLDRLAVIPMFLEARGIDTAPSAVERLTRAGDHATASVLEHIYTDEIKHLRIGVFWFEKLCIDEGHEPISMWKELVQKHLRSSPKGPLNREGRMQAGMSPAYWEN